MAFRNKLLATVAIPLIALTGMPPVSAAELIRPAAPVEAQSLVLTVQATDDELLQQQKTDRRHKKQQAADEQQQDTSGQTQQTDQEQVKPRRKKQQAADDQQQMQQDTSGQTQQTDQEQVKPRRKKQQAADDQQQMQQDNADQSQQTDQEQVKPRRKKQQAADDQQQMQQDDSGQAQQTDQEQVKPRHKKQDNASSDQSQPTDEELKNAIENSNKKHRKQNQDQASEPSSNDAGANDATGKRKKDKQADQADQNDNQSNDQNKVEHPVDVKKAKDIAADPSKTTDTVVLPVENGAAVLDSDKDADNAGKDRDRRKREREDVKPVAVPKSDKDAQAGFKEDKSLRIRPVLEDKGERIPGFKGYDDVGGRRVDDNGTRVVINIGGHIVIRTNDDPRIIRNNQVRYERLPNNLVREIVIQPDGDKIVTVRNRYGEIVRRSRILQDNREVVIFYSPVLERGRDRLFLRDPGADLPPMRLTIPVRDYIIDVSSDRNRNYEQFLDQPPVERVERVYSVDEVKNSARIRDKMRRIDLDTITFDTGSAEISMNQAQSLKQIAAAINDILDKDPGETFLIEGHTDAVGSDESNLVLSDSRAESVANVLSDAFDIPAENLVTQGYGERFLKIDTDGPERANRRVTIRRITPLVRPLAAAEQ